MIRQATKKDLRALEKWLRAEYRKHGQGFYCNWSIIQSSLGSDLFVLDVDGKIVGFVVDGNAGPDIVNVRIKEQGKGYGRQLAEWAIAAAVRRGNKLVEIQIAPETAIPFWEKMGFSVRHLRCSGDPYGYKDLRGIAGLPSQGHRDDWENRMSRHTIKIIDTYCDAANWHRGIMTNKDNSFWHASGDIARWTQYRDAAIAKLRTLMDQLEEYEKQFIASKWRDGAEKLRALGVEPNWDAFVLFDDIAMFGRKC